MKSSSQAQNSRFLGMQSLMKGITLQKEELTELLAQDKPGNNIKRIQFLFSQLTGKSMPIHLINQLHN